MKELNATMMSSLMVKKELSLRQASHSQKSLLTYVHSNMGCFKCHFFP